MTRDTGHAGSLIPQEEILPGAFLLSDVKQHAQSLVSGSGPVDITTPPCQWDFAATFPFHRPESSGVAGGVLLVCVEIEVHNVRIGVGCIARDFRSYVATELDCAPENGPTVLELLLAHSDCDESGWWCATPRKAASAPTRRCGPSGRSRRPRAASPTWWRPWRAPFPALVRRSQPAVQAAMASGGTSGSC